MTGRRTILIPRGRSREAIRATRAQIVNAPSVDDPAFWRRLAPQGETITNPYKQIPWVAAGINLICRLAASIPLRVYMGQRPTRASVVDPKAWIRARVDQNENRKPAPESHEMVRLLEAPNPELPASMFWRAVHIYQITTGEAFVVMLDRTGQKRLLGQLPAELWPYSGKGWSAVRDAAGNEGIDPKTRRPWGWKRGSAIFANDSIVHFRNFDPDNIYRGMATIEPAAVELESDFAAATFNRNFLRQGCNPGGIFKHPKSLTETQRKEFKGLIAEENEGVDKAFSTLLLENGVDFMWNPRSQKDAEFQELRRSARDAALAVLGVQKAALSITDDLNYATALGQRRLLLETTIVPMLADVEDVLWTHLFSGIEGGRYWAAFDLSAVSALQDDVSTKSASAYTFFQMGWSRDTVNARLGLGFDSNEKTDVTITDIQSGGLLPEGEPATDDDAAASSTPPPSQPAGGPTAESTLASGGSVQDTALNGAQIASLVELAAKVQAGELPASTAKAIITVAYPTIDAAEASAIIDPAAAAVANEPDIAGGDVQNSKGPAKPASSSSTPTASPPAASSSEQPDDGPPPRLSHIQAAAAVMCSRSDLGSDEWHAEWATRISRGMEAVVRKVMAKYLRDYTRAQLKAFEAYVRGLAGQGLTVKDIDNILLARKDWDRALQKVASKPMKDVQRLAAKAISKEMKVATIPVNSPRMVELHAGKIASLVRVNEVTQKVLRSQLIEGVSKSETIDAIRQRLNGTLEHIGGNNRALRIARTEVGFMTQGTRHEAMKSNGIKKKRWVSVLGEGTRDDHREEHRHEVGIDERFPVTGLLHPLELGAQPEQVINCDCTAMPVVEGF